jgi:very-short-patch-repair endonuclease
MIKCQFCGKEYTKKGIGTHIWRNHGDGKKFNPNIGYLIGNQKIWNKGLTKENNNGVRKISEGLKGKSAGFSGKKHKKISIDKISQSRIKFLEENPEKVPYLLNHSSKKSYPEKLFEKELVIQKIEGWIYGYQNGIYQYDFAWPKLKIDVEIDGGTHNLEKVKKIDKKRDKFSENKGWKVIRFKAYDVKNNLNNCIIILRNQIGRLAQLVQ